MIHLYLFGPRQLIDSLITLGDAHTFARAVAGESDDTDATLYERLSDDVNKQMTIKGETKHKDTGGASKPELEESAVVVLTPQFGDRFSTIALSIPIQSLYVVSGMNVDMLSALKYLPPKILASLSSVRPTSTQIIPTQIIKKPQSVEGDEDSEASSDLETSPQSLTQTEALSTSSEISSEISSKTALETSSETSSETESPSTFLSSGAARAEFNDERGTVLLTMTDHNVHLNGQSNQSERDQRALSSDWLARQLCEVLGESGRDGVTLLHGFLREDDDESTIDLSMLESEYF